MMTLHKLSAGDGYAYYTEQVASADVRREQGRELGDYYTVHGMPPGQWIGSGVHLLEQYGDVQVGGEVTEAQMKDLFGTVNKPMTGTELAKAYSDATQAGKAAFREATEQHRIRHAETAWVYYKLRQEGATQRQIADAFTTVGTPMSQQAISARLREYEESGNLMPKPGRPGSGLTREAFLANYSCLLYTSDAADE